MINQIAKDTKKYVNERGSLAQPVLSIADLVEVAGKTQAYNNVTSYNAREDILSRSLKEVSDALDRLQNIGTIAIKVSRGNVRLNYSEQKVVTNYNKDVQTAYALLSAIIDNGKTVSAPDSVAVVTTAIMHEQDLQSLASQLGKTRNYALIEENEELPKRHAKLRGKNSLEEHRKERHDKTLPMVRESKEWAEENMPSYRADRLERNAKIPSYKDKIEAEREQAAQNSGEITP